MAAYIIVNVEVHDPERYEDYRKSVLPTLGPYGGRFLVRGGKVEVLEGGWTPKRFVILEFPSADKAVSGGTRRSMPNRRRCARLPPARK